MWLFENLKARILKSIITWSEMGQQTTQAKEVYYVIKYLIWLFWLIWGKDRERTVTYLNRCEDGHVDNLVRDNFADTLKIVGS